MRKLSLLLLACLTLGIAWAERVSVNTAQQVAANVAAGLSPSNLRSNSDLKLVYAAPAKQQSGLRSAGNESDYYIFNVGTGDGFIIVAGEDRVRPVLGYSAEGEVDMEKMPGNMKAWLEMYQEEISWAVSQNVATPQEVQSEWKAYLNGSQLRMGDKVSLSKPTALWGQGEPYNRMTPVINGRHAVTGCVATAMAIVMKYYEYPTQAISGAGVSEYDEISITYDAYDWDNMLDEYDYYKLDNEQFEQGNAVAKLMWHCGANVQMSYGLTASGAVSTLVPPALRNVFGYSQSVQYKLKSDYHWTDWKQMIRAEIDEDRPVILDGSDPRPAPIGGGHAFVCDGYNTDGAFHINWGWEGISNGYFLLSTLDDNYDGYGYSTDQGAVVGIQIGEAAVNTQPVIMRMEYTEGFPLPTNTPIEVEYDIKHTGHESATLYIGLTVIDELNTTTIPAPESSKELQFDSNEPGYYNFYDNQIAHITINQSLTESQRIAFVYSTDGENWNIAAVMSDVPTGLGQNGFTGEYDDPNEPKEPINFSVRSDQFEDLVLEVITDERTESSLNTQRIYYDLKGLTSKAYLCYSLKDVSWADHLRVFYSDDVYTLYKEGQGTQANIENGKWWFEIPAQADRKEFVSDLKILSDQAGTMEYDVQIYNEDGLELLAEIDGRKLTFMNPIQGQFSLDNLKGVVNKAAAFTWTMQNVDESIEGKTATLQFFLQSQSSEHTSMIYIEDGKEIEATYSDGQFSNGLDYMYAEIEIEALKNNTSYSFALKSTQETGDLFQIIRLENILVDGKKLPISEENDYMQIKIEKGVEAQPITWTFTPEDGLNFTAGGEGWFYLTASEIPTEYIGQVPTISFEIEGLLSDEVEIDYVKYGDNGSITQVPLETIPHPDFPTSNVCATQPVALEALGDGLYTFAMRYEGNMDKLPVSCYIWIESVSIGGMEIPSNFKEYSYTITAPDLPIEVSGKEVFYEESHKGKVVNVYSDGIYIVNEPNASIKELRIQPGGQVSLLQELDIEVLNISHFIPTSKWTTFGAPNASEAIVLGEGSSELFKGTLASRIGYSSASLQRWIESSESYFQPGSAALLAQNISDGSLGFHRAQEATGVMTLPVRVDAGEINKPNGNWFHFVANPNWENLQLQGRAYVLDETGLNFALRENPTIKPFEAYMVASDEVMANVSNLRIGDIPTSNEDLSVTGFRVWTESGHVCFETTEAKDVAVYSMNGVQQCRFERSVGMHRQQLPQGIYIVVCDGTAYKVSVK